MDCNINAIVSLVESTVILWSFSCCLCKMTMSVKHRYVIYISYRKPDLPYFHKGGCSAHDFECNFKCRVGCRMTAVY